MPLKEICLPATEQPLPATDIIAGPLPSAKAAGEVSRARAGTGQTEPVLLDRFMQSQASEGEIAPATHAIVGIFEQAGFALRIGAFMFDLLMVMILLLISALLAGSFPAYGGVIQTVGFIITIICLVWNFIFFAAATGQTVGKRLVGIRIITTDQRRADIRQIILRHLLGYPLSMIVFAIGFCWLLWDRQQQGWHDKLARTMVVRKRLNW